MDSSTNSPATWVRMISDNFISLKVSDATADFQGSLHRVELGGVRLTRVGTTNSRVLRTDEAARADACDDLLILMSLSGNAVVRQEDREIILRPGAASVHVANRPYELAFDGSSRVLVLQAPRRIVPSSELLSVERRRVATDNAMTRVYRAFATETLDVADQLSQSEHDELGATAAGLALSVLGAVPDRFASSAEGYRYVLATAQSFIRAHLSNPELSPALVADSQHVSLRTLQLAFAVFDSSPAAFIRAERLDLSRRLLADPRYATLSVSQIAWRVGYPEVNVFIRSFKRQYGTTPGQWRREPAS
ncbi:helix-turn-helix domain-containing protein [Arthrobacter sp. 2RAF6]|uniref:AraC-like ligand-binding domain-containing protein n=1 Tax=Arthrobacter sp. 2RAF6 TaxID=3233002 RepID=UPI003F901DD2